jgi:hypothetical protein
MRKREIWGFWAKEGQSSKPFMQNKANFPQAQMSASSIITKDYENKCLSKRMENKPKQSQSQNRRQKTEFRKQNPGLSEKSLP